MLAIGISIISRILTQAYMNQVIQAFPYLSFIYTDKKVKHALI